MYFEPLFVLSPFHAVSVDLLLNTRSGNISPQYNAVFYDTFSTVNHMSKVAVPVNRENLVEEHSDLAKQENVTLAR